MLARMRDLEADRVVLQGCGSLGAAGARRFTGQARRDEARREAALA